MAALLSTAGWLTACRRVLGDAWLATPGGVLEPEDARRLASATDLAPPPGRSRFTRVVPTVAMTAFKDARQMLRGGAFKVSDDGPWRGHHLEFVWQRHELFHTAGVDFASRLGVPSVVFAPATPVWEARRWGVSRPGWGALAERFGEQPTLRRASLVACGSDEVAEQVQRMGVSPDSILVTPTGVDLEQVDGHEGRAVRSALGLGDGFVLGWMGSFRPFHAVHRLVEAVAGLNDVTLLMVGDGPERPAVEALAGEVGVRAVFTGTVPHTKLTAHLAAMDAAVVVAPDDGSFHYSPLKLAEYLAAGLPVVAPDVPTISSRLDHGVHALLVEPTDRLALSSAIARLRDDPALRADLGKAARVEVESSWSWDFQVRRVRDHLQRVAGV
ncbi:MAG: glycosyltransferase family 4 protein [Acidimicrobiales bacterium]|nr:glycosyltransferase family 4 protein [Acidimicrobiales bacterium]